jgi:hypothetical protein
MSKARGPPALTFDNGYFDQFALFLAKLGGSGELPAYRHYRLDGSGSISKAEWIEASDDADAVRQVQEKKLSVASEIWDRDRRVAKLDAAGTD